jgi:hypothetical protein
MVLLAVDFESLYAPSSKRTFNSDSFPPDLPPFLPTSDTLGTPLATVPIVAGGKDNPAVTPNGDLS